MEQNILGILGEYRRLLESRILHFIEFGFWTVDSVLLDATDLMVASDFLFSHFFF